MRLAHTKGEGEGKGHIITRGFCFSVCGGLRHTCVSMVVCVCVCMYKALVSTDVLSECVLVCVCLCVCGAFQNDTTRIGVITRVKLSCMFVCVCVCDVLREKREKEEGKKDRGG